VSAPYFFTWAAQRGARGMEITGGEGAWFTTGDGGRWLDLGSLAYQAHLGHGHRGVMDAVAHQAQTLSLGMPTSVFPAKTELAERLLELSGFQGGKVFFTLGGAEANENALKMARSVTGRYKVVSRYRSYHGATFGAIAMTGDWRRQAVEPAMPGAVHVLDCYCDRCPFGQHVVTCKRECALQFDEVLPLEGNVGAVILEPVSGANGVLVPPPEYWPMVRAACDRHGALLIADEVLTGFGRLGKAFGHQHWSAVPDIITVAKGLTAGYAPLGAVIVNERVARHFDDHLLAAGLTYYAHPLGCAAGVATLAAYAGGDLYARAAALGPVLLGELRAQAARAPGKVLHTRGLGLLAALELDLDAAAWQRLGAGLAQRRLLLHADPRRGTAIFAPPLVIDEADLVAGVRAFGDALESA
jgi:taurine--2-oxoglutarate transaminase